MPFGVEMIITFVLFPEVIVGYTEARIALQHGLERTQIHQGRGC